MPILPAPIVARVVTSGHNLGAPVGIPHPTSAAPTAYYRHEARKDGSMSSWSRALDDLVRERGAALFGYAYVLTGNAADAEDLVQNALVRTFRTGRATRGLDATHAYVKRAIASAFIDGHRRSQARPQRASGDAGDVAASPGSAVAHDHAPGVDEALDLHRAILLLPPRERACVVLRYL